MRSLSILLTALAAFTFSTGTVRAEEAPERDAPPGASMLALEHHGQAEQSAGGALLGVGAASLVAGIVLAATGDLGAAVLWPIDSQSEKEQGGRFIAGAALGALGIGAVVAGAIVLADGAGQVKRAHHLSSLGAAPLVGRSHGGVASASFSF